MIEDILIVNGLRKTFNMSRKQQKLEKTNLKVKVAVNDISFNVHKGEIYGLLGPNGAGKTTTLRMLATLIKPDSGDALVNSYSIVKEADKVRENIGFLTSELKLEDFFTPDYLFDFFARLHHMDEDLIKKRKEELFSKFGINEFREVKVADLSTGMKQKVSIVIAICHNPSIVIFDEPTNGLDIVATKDVEDYLISLKNENKIILISTHIFSIIEKLCDKVAVILHGEKVLEGDLKDLTKEKSLSDIFFELYTEEE